MAVSKRKKAPIAKKAKRKPAKKRKKTERTSERTGLSTADYAKHAGISRQAVTKQIQRGLFGKAAWKVGRSWMVDPKGADKARAENLHPKKEAAPAEEAMPAARPAPNPGPKSTLAQVPTLKLHDAQALLAETKAGIAQLELEELKGSLIKADEVRLERFAQARMVRDNLMGLPAKVAPLLMSIKTEAEMTIALEQYFMKALKSLTEEHLEGKGRAAG